jgi:hypothetical protein
MSKIESRHLRIWPRYADLCAQYPYITETLIVTPGYTSR